MTIKRISPIDAVSLTLGKGGKNTGAKTLVLSGEAIIGGIAVGAVIVVLLVAGLAGCVTTGRGDAAGRVAGAAFAGEAMFVVGGVLALATSFVSGNGAFEAVAGVAVAGAAAEGGGVTGFSAGVGGGAAASTFAICATGPLAFIAFSNGALVRSFASGWRFQCFATFFRPEI